jgi:tetratricopeptide (TPR) repeat protein
MHTRNLLRSVLILCLLSSALPAVAQHDHGNPAPPAGIAAKDLVGWVPRAVLEKPTVIHDGIGTVRDDVASSSEEAKAFYRQGVAWLHSYVWIEAARSFNQAARIDPKMPMAYVGLSQSYSNLDDLNAAEAALGKAKALAPQAGDLEKLRIAAEAKRLEALHHDDSAHNSAYREALDAALKLAPKNEVLMLLRGNATEDSAYGRGQGGRDDSITWYLKVIEINPDNFGAHHFLIHSYEQVNKIDKALAEGEIYARMAPAVPHAHHMYGHDLRRVNQVNDAIAQFQKADDLEREYYAREGIDKAFDWHHPHNLHLLAMCYQYLGQMNRAEPLLREANSTPSAAEYQEAQKVELVEFLMGRERYADALAESQKLFDARWPLARALAHTMAGSAYVRMGKRKDAEKELKKSGKEVRWSGRRGDYDKIYSKMLKAEIELAKGHGSAAEDLSRQVISSSRDKKGPDGWIQTLFRIESLAKSARQFGDWQLAGYAAQQMKEHDPGYGGTHLALAYVAENRHDSSQARAEYDAALKAWAAADSDLPEIRRLAQRPGSSAGQ